jgi:carbohydrate kinase (thermoresistant glucokinase family)
MLDKIRLHARGVLPAEYQPNLGEVRVPLFDARCCRFLGVPYEELRARVLLGGCDEEILDWAQARGTARNDEDCLIWNGFMTKIGWRDNRSDQLAIRIAEYGLGDASPQTFCELFDADEGRPLGGTRSWEGQPVSVVIVMGVSGCGKTTVGKGLAAALQWEFLEADDFHPASNVAKMSAGVPLTDADRAPWLSAVHEAVVACSERGARVVVACSALKESYRLVLAPDPAGTRFAFLRGDYSLIKERLGGRTGHFMKESLLRSQFEALEAPAYALTLDAAEDAATLVNKVREVLGIP